MKMLRWIAVLILGFVFSFQVAEARNQASSAIKEYLQKSSFVVEEEFWAYHYLHADYPYKPLQYLNAQRLMWGGYFELGSGVAGPGLYVALDPWSTWSYGETLLAFAVKKGTRFWLYSGLTEVGDQDSEKEVRSVLKANGCVYDYAARDIVTYAIRSDQNYTCQNFVKRMLVRSGIKGIVYTYGGYSFDKDCLNLDRAISLFDPSAISFNKFFVVSRNRLDKIPSELGFFRSIINQYGNGTDEKVREWLKPRTLGCQAQGKRLKSLSGY